MGLNSYPRSLAGQTNMRKSGEKRRDAGMALGNKDLEERGATDIYKSKRIQNPRPNKHKFGGRNNRRQVQKNDHFSW